MTKYILGGGMSALFLANRNPEYTVLTPEFGGFVNNKFARAFIYLHDGPRVRGLLDELDAYTYKKRLKIEHWDRGFVEPDDEFTKEYLSRKLPERFQPDMDSAELSAPGTEFDGLFMDANIVDELKRDIDSEIGIVRGITEDHIQFAHNKQKRLIEWDSILSTLPAPIFKDLWAGDLDWELDAHPVTFVEAPHIQDRVKTRPWNLLYSISDPYHRIARNMLSSKYYLEYLGEFDSEHPHFTHDRGVIDEEDIEPPDGIELYGRRAEWDPNILLNDVLEKQDDR